MLIPAYKGPIRPDLQSTQSVILQEARDAIGCIPPRHLSGKEYNEHATMEYHLLHTWVGRVGIILSSKSCVEQF